MSILSKIIYELGKLSEEEIRELFQKENIKGKRAKGFSCPVANWCHRKGLSEVIISKTTAEDFYIVGNRSYTKESIPLPITIKRFISNFDQAKYPELLAGD